MPLELVTIPCLKDNYAYLAYDRVSGQTACIDVPDAGAVLAELDSRGWRLSAILITHHHGDHTDGVAEVKRATGACVLGNGADKARLPPLDWAFGPGDKVAIGQSAGVVIDVSGHTLGHVAFSFPDSGLAFTGDSLMAGGCGRLFEGTAAQMWDSLSRLARLPPQTRICSGHEYTAANLRFAATLEPASAPLMSRMQRVAEARAEGRPTVPSILSDELETNPFLRAGLPEMKALLGMEAAPDAEVFAELRSRKDRF